MVRPIMKDPLFLSKKSEAASPADLPVVFDLLQTLDAHGEACVGMAANMIGISKRIIAFFDEEAGANKIMLNPVIVKKSGPYETVEGCLSLTGERPCTRYQTIEVEYQDAAFKKQRGTFTGLTAEIIQHECDHLEGVLI